MVLRNWKDGAADSSYRHKLSACTSSLWSLRDIKERIGVEFFGSSLVQKSRHWNKDSQILQIAHKNGLTGCIQTTTHGTLQGLGSRRVKRLCQSTVPSSMPKELCEFSVLERSATTEVRIIFGSFPKEPSASKAWSIFVDNLWEPVGKKVCNLASINGKGTPLEAGK